MLSGRMPPLPQPWNLVIVDDDIGGPYPAPSRDPLISALRTGGVDLVVDARGDGSRRGRRLIALFGDIRAWKGRPGLFRRCQGGGAQRSGEAGVERTG